MPTLRRIAASVLATAPLVSIFYAGWKAAGLPFVPFAIFDWLTRILPGRVVIFGVEALAGAVRLFHPGSTSSAAKSAELSLAVVIFVVAVVAAGLLLLAARPTGEKRHYAAGAAFGALLGGIGFVISLGYGSSGTEGTALGGVWIVGCFALWGAGLAWLGRRLGVRAAPEDGARPGRSLSRRGLLWTAGGVSAAVTAAGVLAGLRSGEAGAARTGGAFSGVPWSSTHPLPNAAAGVRPVRGVRPEFTSLAQHYRIDIDTIPPRIREEEWRLRVYGLVDRPAVLKLEDLRSRYEPVHQFITLACISNPIGGDLIGTTRWTGVSLQRLLADLGVKSNATHLKLRSADGFWETVPLDVVRADERVMLTYAWDGLPLAVKHGFPLRVYVPDVYGMKQPKWIQSIEVTDHWEQGYWVVRGWDAAARMKATSVVDGIASMTVDAGRRVLPVGGFAHAGARGISRVEVQVDGGEWRPAQLREPLSGLTWVSWRYDWPASAGRHTFTVRCVDGRGEPQPAQVASSYPDGASGHHSRTVDV